ncbi:phosphoribosylaminoimidazolesuccinocarboxamide synthase [Methanobacterium sp. ACI-7]|uniref:phosphoribosylaminoimidazolesuccinocarboxamide synthase n=1 Tax=unclassified Methanobacterium TaxID=2627676 RepID=UPI0039C346B7
MGSVKDLEIIKKPTKDEIGIGQFTFSDRYSIFDWGEMPDHIMNKGSAIAIMGAYFFERLEEIGIKTHYMGLVEDGEVKKLSEVKEPVNKMQIKLLRVLEPMLKEGSYDYSSYKNENAGFLIPLEVIYRNSLPAGSSVFRRLEKGEIKPEDMGFDKAPTPNQKLSEPVLDVSTKLEITDRYLTWVEAQEIANLTDEELNNLKELTKTVNKFITDEFSKMGMINEDGKIELGYDLNRDLMLVDVLGTLDECRFTFNGLPVSKEITRIFYKDSEWHCAVEKAKEEDREKWKLICELEPQKLPERLSKLISNVYCACTNEITGREWFKDVPPLKETLDEIEKELNQ